ncbi:MAG: alpha/beta hydrolase [Pseudomonadota bacterium]
MARWDKAAPASIPQWFFEAVEYPASDHSVEVEDCDVHYRLWTGAGTRGLLFVHGMHAHAHWWDFIAPALTDEYRVAAIDLTGMGDSDYRYDYSAALYAEEIRAVCDAAGFGTDALLAAHSFGGRMALEAVHRWPERFGGLALLDSGVRDPNSPEFERPPMGGNSKLYPDRETGEARFRLQPPQDCANEYILRYIARHSLMPIDGGYAWKFDDDLLKALTGLAASDHLEDYLRDLQVPIHIMIGADSVLYSEQDLAYMVSLLPAALQDDATTVLADAQHHLFLDQPLAFTDALRKALAAL